MGLTTLDWSGHHFALVMLYSIYGSNICVNKTEIDIKEKGIDYSGGS